jgi:hypothetical protein
MPRISWKSFPTDIPKNIPTNIPRNIPKYIPKSSYYDTKFDNRKLSSSNKFSVAKIAGATAAYSWWASFF